MVDQWKIMGILMHSEFSKSPKNTKVICLKNVFLIESFKLKLVDFHSKKLKSDM